MVSYTYDAYGNTTVNTGSPLNNPYQYNAEYTDSSTGNQYLRARYYDPASGRFLTKDTYLGETNDPLSRNLYAYTRNNPVNLVDPSGHLFGTIMAIVAVTAAVVGTYKAVKSHNEQSKQIRNQQASYERNASSVQENVTTKPSNLKAPTSPNQKGTFSYYNERDKKVVTFTNAAAYFEYKKLCDELDKLDKNLALSIVHNTLDAAGVIPGFGEVADAANGFIYLAEGDVVNAGLSFLSCIPVAGDAAGKGGKALNTALDYSDDALDLVSGVTKYGDDVADFAGDSTKYLDDILDPPTPPKPDPVVIEYKTHGDPDEFLRQLQDQQDGLNSMSAGEIKNNIDNYRQNGRPNEAQKAITDYRATHDVPKGNDVLHGPDMSIGGSPTGITGYGDSGVNRSIGRQNGYRQDTIYDVVSSLPSDSPVNFQFVVQP